MWSRATAHPLKASFSLIAELVSGTVVPPFLLLSLYLSQTMCLEADSTIQVPFLKKIEAGIEVCVNPTSGSLDIDATVDFNAKVRRCSRPPMG